MLSHPDFLPLALHESEYPAARRRALVAALAAGRLPGKLLYQSPAQARRWLDYHAAWSPSRTDDALRALYGEAFRAAATVVAGGGGAPCLVGLGCGGGRKDGDALAVLGGQGPDPHYLPVDASAPLVAEAALHARERCPGVRLHPLVADLAAAPALEPWLAGPGRAAGARLYTCFGMVPNQPPGSFPGWLAALLRPGDGLLVSANLSPSGYAGDGVRIAGQYDNGPARAWYAGALLELGLEPADHRLEVHTRRLAAEDGCTVPWGAEPDAAWQVVVTARLSRDATLAVEGAPLPVREGTALEVFRSQRFTLPAAAALLEAAGLRIVQHWLHAGGEEGIFLCRRA